MRLLDTNVFFYTTGRQHAYQRSCIRLLSPHGPFLADLSIDAELLQEILYVYDARGERQRALQSADDILSLFPNPIPIGREQIVLARSLMASHPQLRPRDAIRAAVVVEHHMEGIISADKVFDRIAGVTRFDPLSY